MATGVSPRMPMAGALVCFLGAGCFSSAYTPAADGRVSEAMARGSVVYVRDGEHFSSLSAAVGDNPAALKHARTYERRRRIGSTLLWTGILGTVVASAILASQDVESSYAEVGVWSAGLGVIYGGMLVVGSGHPYKFDALNIYNDAVPGPAHDPHGLGAAATPGTTPAPEVPAAIAPPRR